MTEAEEYEAEAARLHREAELADAQRFEAEYSSLPLVLVGVLPLLVFASILMAVFGLKSKWWYTLLIALPALALYLYPFLLRHRMKTALRMPGGQLIRGKSKRDLIIIAAILVTTLLVGRMILFSLSNNW